MRPTSFHTVLMLICALTLAPLLPAFAQASAFAQNAASACAVPDASMADTHMHHTQADEPVNADSGCAQNDACGGACCAQCAHCFMAATGTDITGPAGASVFTAARLTGRSLLIPDLLERPPRLLS